MKELALHILDLAQNSITAEANLIELEIAEDLVKDKLTIILKDNGFGMDKDMADKVKDPFVTTRTSRKVGLGIPLMLAACERCEGSFVLDSEKNVGTQLTATFKHSHIDRAPLGNMPETIITLVLCCGSRSYDRDSGAPDSVDLVYTHKINDSEFCFDTREIKKILGEEVSLAEPEILSWIKDYISEGLNNLRGGV